MTDINRTAGLNPAKVEVLRTSTAAKTPQGGNSLPPQEIKQTNAAVKEQLAVSSNEVKEAVAKLNDYVQSTQRDLYFSVDEATGKTVVQVVDRGSDEVVRQIPDDVVLNLARKLNSQEPLRLFSAQA